ncbi:hypothetical protein [Pseudarthrobacter sp. efr-133-R2A-89]|uniref:hypothetical protein n=1 Tax=Pseudarthrobacter sp. efr-133-R2A-89 TaxID=3040302 RepID=UPI00255604FE|nr:hypothetical protein [Pseudarthrobacter sp. efr-133-R2A-89]
MNSSSPYNPDTDAATEALPAPVPLTAPGEDHGSFPGQPAEIHADDEPFIPRKRYTPGRTTKVLVCVLLVVAGFFGGSMVQKQLDLGARAGRANVGNFQGTNGRAGAGAGNTSGTPTPGQGRRNGNNGATAPAAAPTGAAGQ